MNTVKEHFTKFDETLTSLFKRKWAPFVFWPAAVLLMYAVYFLFIYQQEMYGKIGFNSETSFVIFIIFLVIYELLVAAYFTLSAISGRLSKKSHLPSFHVLRWTCSPVHNGENL